VVRSTDSVTIILPLPTKMRTKDKQSENYPAKIRGIPAISLKSRDFFDTKLPFDDPRFSDYITFR
jgi:hypothetical protein